MKKISIILILTSNFILPIKANAACVCACVNGKVQAICSSIMDLAPLCTPKLCPLTTPKLKPFDSLKLPPLGTTSCTNKQVYNYSTGSYEWKELCN